MKLLVWDFDGTLAYREGMWSGTLAEVAAQSAPDLQARREDFRPFLSRGFRWHNPEKTYPVGTPEEWWAELHPLFVTAYKHLGLPVAQAEALAVRVRQQYTDPGRWRVFPDVIPVLEELKKDGWTHSILTNHVPEFRELLSALQLTPYFRCVVNSAETGFEKPHPQAFAAVLRAVGEAPTQVCMIGDSLNADIRGAEEVNWPALLVRNEGIRWQAASLEEVPALLDLMLR